MRNKNISYPHPILGVNDDVMPELQEGCVELAIKDRRPIDFVFTITLNQDNKMITDLIKSGKAEYACEVECKETYLRRCYHSPEPSIEMVINRKDLCGNISFNSFIALKEPLKNYDNPGFHEDYEGFTFDLEVGDLLAIFPTVSHNIDIRYDKLYAAGTYMQIAEGRADQVRPWFNLEGNKISIELPKEMYKQYLTFANTQYIDFIHASLVYNALVYALREREEDPERYKGRLWFDSLEARIECDEQLKHIDSTRLTGIYEMADIILGNPYKRMFDKLQSIQ